MLSFCTLFDRNYLPHALTMYNSLSRFVDNFELYILCLDEDSNQIMKSLNLPNIIQISIVDLENEDNNLLEAKSNRSKVEYYFTLSPALPLYIFRRFDLNSITYLDSDLFFFSSPDIIFSEIGNSSISIIEHRFHPRYSEMVKYGRYNVGWITFQRDANSMQCLEVWYKQCLEWCYKKLEDGRFGDQKYLDEWPTRYSNVKIIQNVGANLAPWNLENYSISLSNDFVKVEDKNLVFFHFHGFKRFFGSTFSIGYSSLKLSRLERATIFAPYVSNINQNVKLLNTLVISNNMNMPVFKIKNVFEDSSIAAKIRYVGSLIIRIIRGNFVLVS